MIIISFLHVYSSKKNKEVMYIKNRIFTIEKLKIFSKCFKYSKCLVNLSTFIYKN